MKKKKMVEITLLEGEIIRGDNSEYIDDLYEKYKNIIMLCSLLCCD